MKTLTDIKENLEIIKNTIENIENNSIEELKEYIKITLEHKMKFYPEIKQLITKCIKNIDEINKTPM